MDRTNLELFKQAIRDGICKRCDSIAAECAGEITCSDGHSLAMRTIVYGKAEKARSLSPRARQIIAILVAAALLLTGCGIIFRNEIREIVDNLFISLDYGEDGEKGKNIEHVYALDYLPKGYNLKTEEISSLYVRYIYSNEHDQVISFTQTLVDNSEIVIDKENGYSDVIEINGLVLYCRYGQEIHNFAWLDKDYIFTLYCDSSVPDSEIISIITEITMKK